MPKHNGKKSRDGFREEWQARRESRPKRKLNENVCRAIVMICEPPIARSKALDKQTICGAILPPLKMISFLCI